MFLGRGSRAAKPVSVGYGVGHSPGSGFRNPDDAARGRLPGAQALGRLLAYDDNDFVHLARGCLDAQLVGHSHDFWYTLESLDRGRDGHYLSGKT